MSRAVPVGVVRGAYPERLEEEISKLDRAGLRLVAPLDRRRQAAKIAWAKAAQRVLAEEERCADMSEAALAGEVRASGQEMRRSGFRDDLVVRCFAGIREVARRTLGMAHFECQIQGGLAMLHGCIAEMQTGEGKTLTATLPVCAAALAGVPTHLVTVNDYLAQRDADSLGALYTALGLSVGVIVSGMEPKARQAAYACDVTYCTNKEVVFDYLKDRITLGGRPSGPRLRIGALAGRTPPKDRLLHRGLHFAVVDEADSVLIDEARTPLIIAEARRDPAEQRLYEEAVGLAETLERGLHFDVDERERRIELGVVGRRRLGSLTEGLGGLWRGRRRREELVRQALSAHHLFVRDEHYLVRDDTVQIIDEHTGRVMPDRSWEHGLHQMIEVKEGLPITGRQDTLARIGYQRFFQRYHRLAGMTGTAREVEAELWDTYRLPVVTISTHRPCRRRSLGERIHATSERKWEACVARIGELHREGRPVLVGTRSLAASEALSARLAEAGLPHQVLNARQNAEEAGVVAEAGQPGRITVATNMAGRGTDIRLAEGVAEKGGLHVLATELHDSARVDRQLQGRCARQGDPGTCEALLSLDDELFRVHGGPLAAALRHRGERAVRRLGPWVAAAAQRRAGRLHAHMRRELQRSDTEIDKLLAFSSASE